MDSNNSNLNISERYIGIILYGYDWFDKGEYFLDYALRLQELQNLPPFSKYLADLRERRRRKYHSWKKENILKLKNELIDKKIRWLVISSQKEPKTVLWVTFDNHRVWPKVVNYCVTAIPESLLKSHNNLIWDLVNLSGQLAVKVNIPYGCVVIGGKNDKDIVAFADQFRLEGMPIREYGSWNKWQYLMDKYVRGAYWGNFLNNNHLQKLGGKEHAIKQDFIKHHLDFDNKLTFISVTSNISEATTQEGQHNLDQLYEFLKPIGMPEFDQKLK